MKELLAAGTGAADSASVVVSAVGTSAPITILVTGMATGDTADLEISPDDGTTWHKVYVDGAQVQFAYQSTNVYSIFGPGTYRVARPSTTGSVAVYVAESMNE